MSDFYLQHGGAGGPMRTERVTMRTSHMKTPRRHSDGSVPTYWMVSWDGRWYRVWTHRVYGHFIRSVHGEDNRIKVEID